LCFVPFYAPFYATTRMLETNNYVRCLMIDFAKAFDEVDHAILLGKLQTLNIDQFALNWIVSFLSNRCQVCKIDGSYSMPLLINQGIVQGSGLGLFLYLVMESDLNALSVLNLIFKYADDTNLLVPEYTDRSPLVLSMIIVSNGLF